MTARRGKARKPKYERLAEPLLSWPLFFRRAVRHFLLGVLAILVADGIGIVGYHVLAELGWVDSFLNASMILGGMGPVDSLKSDSAKLFAGVYALFSGLVFIAIMSIVIAPWVHRMIHVMHAEEDA
jgi:hypothetical protein